IANIKPRERHTFHSIVSADADHVWFGPDTLLRYDRKTGKVHVVPPTPEDEKREHKGSATWMPGGWRSLLRLYVQSATWQHVPGLRPSWTPCLRERETQVLVGAGKPTFNLDDGGLFAVNPKTLAWTKLGHAACELSHFRVNRIVFDDDAKKAYVCTDGGVTI